MDGTAKSPFWNGPIDDRIARLESLLASPHNAERHESALRLALRVLQQVRLEEYAAQLAS